MNEMRERLMQLLGEAIEPYLDRIYPWDTFSDIADHLLDNGVIVPLVTVGQTVWYIEGGYYNSSRKRPREKTVTEINLKRQSGKTEWGFIADGTRYRFKSIGKTVFLTREAAEETLKAREQNERGI